MPRTATAENTSGSYGTIPAHLNPFTAFSWLAMWVYHRQEVKISHSSYAITRLPGLDSIHLSIWRLYIVFNGPKKVKSNGWRRLWLVWGGIVSIVTWCFCANSTASRDLRLLWPSIISNTGLESFGLTHLMKIAHKQITLNVISCDFRANSTASRDLWLLWPSIISNTGLESFGLTHLMKCFR